MNILDNPIYAQHVQALTEVGLEQVAKGAEYGQIIQEMNFYGLAHRIQHAQFEQAVEVVHAAYYNERA